MTRKEKSKIICGNLMKKFDWLKSQETVLVAAVMDSLMKIEVEELREEMQAETQEYAERE